MRFPVLQGSFWSVQRSLTIIIVFFLFFPFSLSPFSSPFSLLSFGFPCLHLFRLFVHLSNNFFLHLIQQPQQQLAHFAIRRTQQQLLSTSYTTTSTTTCTHRNTSHSSHLSLALLCRNMVILHLGCTFFFFGRLEPQASAGGEVRAR